MTAAAGATPVTLITGANSGMGLASARALAALGHDLLLCVRSPATMEAPAEALRRRYPQRRLVIEALDLSSLRSVHDAAARIADGGLLPENLLCNAGVMTPPYMLTEDGFESQFQVNYLGHFALFHELHRRLPAGTLQKIVSISSLSSEKAVNDHLDTFTALACCPADGYDALRCYREAKLAQVMFARSLAERYAAEGLLSASVHPGIVNTSLFYRRVGTVTRALIQPLAWLGYLSGRLATPAKGARTAVRLVAEPFAPNGLYWHAGQVHPHNPLADDRDLRDALWDWSLQAIAAGAARPAASS
jgi:NAD(P)-dependent dehydrogenase (short-subunit alcohol dehydrogenase family)